MTNYSKFNVIYRLQKWLDSVPGQTFMNYAYSWGASIVILGTLFKLTHLPGANFMLFLGMGTEVVVFFIAAFDRPFDKTADGMELPTHVGELTEEETASESIEVAGAQGYQGPAVVGGGGTIVIGGGSPVAGEQTVQGHEPVNDTEAIAQVATSVAAMSGGIVLPQQGAVSPEMEEATNNYVEELKRLTEMLSRVSDQSQRLARDSEEMENLNRTLTGICKVYELQLKGASQQIGTIDEINEQTRKMADQIVELNKIYTRMIDAMTVNMPKAVPQS
jgi:hypothetical protein